VLLRIFSFANKQLLTHWIREDMERHFPKFKAEVVYDLCHNIAKFENYEIDGVNKKVLVTRKGGQPVLIPGSMGTSSYVFCGSRSSDEISFGSSAHGAGRVKSRSKIREEI